jgi:spectinomycin phosphotransferase
MLEPPDLPEETIAAAVRAAYGIAPAALTFLPLGNDAATWVYRLQGADGAVVFLKLRSGAANAPSFLVPRYLVDHGVANVVAARPTAAGALWVDLEGFTLALYPFVDGRTGGDAGLAEHHWVTYGVTLRRIHETVLPPAIAEQTRRETFVPEPAAAVRRLDELIGARRFAEPFADALAAFWRERRTDLRPLADRIETLGERLRAADPPRVLCHADVHTWNVLIDTAGRLWIVDWDETLLAPRECDLMMVVGGLGPGLVGPRETALFFEGYGATPVDPLSLAYYRYLRALGDIAADAERVYSMPELGAESRRQAVRLIKSCFRPGGIIDLAYEADRSRP